MNEELTLEASASSHSRRKATIRIENFTEAVFKSESRNQVKV